MCIAIFQRPGKSVPDHALWEGWKTNRDGGGFAYIDPETQKVVISKGFMTFNDFVKAYRGAVETYPDSPFLIHMRVKTSGHISPTNTHPFAIKGGAMIHNGNFFTPGDKHQPNKEDLKSDTRVFAETLFNILDYDSVVAAETGVRRAIGEYQRVAFLYDDGRSHIYNEKGGYWDNDIWYSNKSCFTYGDSVFTLQHPNPETK